MNGEMLLMLAAFGVVSSIVMMLVMVLGSRDGERVESRLGDMASSPRRGSRPPVTGRSPLPRMGAMILPEDETKLGKLRGRLQQAGLYRRHASAVFMGVKLVLLLLPLGVGLGMAAFGTMTLTEGVLFGVIVGVLGNVLPSLWLSVLKSGRQKQIRRALPDALDVIVVCIEGGLSLPAAFAKVATELRVAHSLLADEMSIMRREIQLGRSTGEALRQFAERFDIEELRSMSSVVLQAEKFGASVVKALRVHADTLRIKRYQYAEAMAQKAPVKLIFPTVFCIFPALYIVLMGPAGVRLLELLDSFGQ